MKNRTLLAYFGHHKCASRYINSIVSSACIDLHLNHKDTLVLPGNFNENLNEYVKKHKVDFLTFSNADIEHLDQLNNLLGFHVIRDPRDITVSGYFSHLYSHPFEDGSTLAEHNKRLKNTSKDEGLFLEMQFCRREFEDMFNWDYNRSNIMEIKMENMMKSPYDIFVKIFLFLQLVDQRESFKYRFFYCLKTLLNRLPSMFSFVIPSPQLGGKIHVNSLLGYVYQNRFSRKTKGRKKGNENIKSHYRKGVSGDWKIHFNNNHKAFFSKNYNDLLLKLGYETSGKW